MLQFPSFKSATRYQSECPLCAGELLINDRDLATEYGYKFRGENPKISFFLDQREQDVISIDPDNDEIEYIDDYRSIRGGVFMHALTIDCKSCCQYNFRLQIHFNMKELKLAGVFLDSETISIEDCEMVHEIKNSYAVSKTYYSYFDKNGSSRRSELPLINLDLSNPRETVSRIRKLLIFS